MNLIQFSNPTKFGFSTNLVAKTLHFMKLEIGLITSSLRKTSANVTNAVAKCAICICLVLATILFTFNDVSAQCNACGDTYIAAVTTTLAATAAQRGGFDLLTRADFEAAVNGNFATFNTCMAASCQNGRRGRVRRRCRRLCRNTAKRIRGLALLGNSRRIPANFFKRRFRRRCRRACR